MCTVLAMTNSTRNYRVTEHGDVTNYYATANGAAAYRDAANGYRDSIGQPSSFVVQSYDWDSDEWTVIQPQPVYRARGGKAA